VGKQPEIAIASQTDATPARFIPQVRFEGDAWTHFWHALLPSLANAGLAICNKVRDSSMEGRSLPLCFLTPSLVSRKVQFVHSLLMREAEIAEKFLLYEQDPFFVGKESAYQTSHIFYPIFGRISITS
jgi:hypothetical protein